MVRGRPRPGIPVEVRRRWVSCAIMSLPVVDRGQRTSSTRSAYVTGNHYEPDLVNISIKDAGYFDVHFSGFKEIQWIFWGVCLSSFSVEYFSYMKRSWQLYWQDWKFTGLVVDLAGTYIHNYSKHKNIYQVVIYYHWPICDWIGCQLSTRKVSTHVFGSLWDVAYRERFDLRLLVYLWFLWYLKVEWEAETFSFQAPLWKLQIRIQETDRHFLSFKDLKCFLSDKVYS